MKRQLKNGLTFILAVITVLSLSLFGACDNGTNAVVPTGEDKIVENADGTPQDYGAKYVLYSTLGKLKGYNTYEESTVGESKASKGIINYVQTISSRNVKNGDELYFESDSRSSLVTSTHSAFEKGDKVVFISGDSEIYCVSVDDYKAVYGVTPAKMLCGFLIKDDTVVRADRNDAVLSTDEFFVYNYEIDKTKGAELISLQMREFGKLNGLPEYLENIKLTLTVRNDFTPVRLEISEKYKISVALVGELECEQNTVSVFSKFNEQVEIPYSDDYNEALGSTPTKIDPATGKQTDENLETIVSALLAQDVKNGVVLNGEVEYNGFRVPLAVSLKADVDSILNGDKPFAEAISVTLSALPSTRAVNLIYDNHKVYINVADLKYVISTNLGSGESSVPDLSGIDIMKLIKVSRLETDENVYKIELSDELKPIVQAILEEAGLAEKGEKFDFALEFYIVGGRVGTAALKFKTSSVSFSLDFAVSDKRYVLPADLNEYKVLDRRDFDVKLNLLGFETEGKVAVSYDFLKAGDPVNALEIDARLKILSQKVSIYELAKMFDEKVDDALKETDGADEIEFAINGGKAYVLIYKQNQNVYAKAFDLPELDLSGLLPSSDDDGEETDEPDEKISQIAAILKMFLGASIETDENYEKFVCEIKIRDEIVEGLGGMRDFILATIIENIPDENIKNLLQNPDFTDLLGFDRTLDKVSVRYETSMGDASQPGEFIIEIVVKDEEAEDPDAALESVIYLGVKAAETGSGSAISDASKEIIKKLAYI